MPDDWLSGTILFNEPAIIAPGVIVFIAFLALWIGDRRHTYNLYWGLGSVLLAASGALLAPYRPVLSGFPVMAGVINSLCSTAGLVCYIQGAALYRDTPLRARTMSLLLLALMLVFNLMIVLGAMSGYALGGYVYDVIILLVFGWIAHRLAPMGRWEKAAAALMMVRAANGNYLIALLPSYHVADRVTLNQLFSLGTGIALLAAGFLRAQRELDRERQSLEKAVEERTAQLRAQTEALQQSQLQLQQANTELESFSYSVSHDLRAPLRTLDGFSLALSEDYGAQLDPAARDYIERIRGAAQRMGMLIEKLLELSRLSRAPLLREEVDLAVLAAACVARLRLAEPQRSVEVTIATGLRVRGDAGLLGIALDNLLGNAWKYSGKQPRSRIEFGEQLLNGERVFSVRDNGAGFDMRYANKLFGAFQRLHEKSEFDGTGIGLTTVQRIVHRHGGRIWAESEPGAGATFSFTIPDAML